DKVFHIQNVNNYHGKLKAWVARFRGVASKDIHKYVGWLRWFEQTEKSKQTIEQFLSWRCLTFCEAPIRFRSAAI
ncbi:MAG: hypothetical protein LPH20_02765, partial [Shewanella sp.]|nr:hypothetical protein [Shewanella sp.]